MSGTFRGIYAALTTPFESNGDISLQGLRRNIGFTNPAGLAGYVVLGSTGESVFLSDAESEALAAAAVEAAAPGRTIIAGTARESTRLTVDFTNRLASLGVRAALVRTPAYYKSRMTAEAQKAYFLSVAEGSRIPVLIYNFPQNTGISLDSEVVVALAGHPNIAGIKDSSGNLTAVGEIVPNVREDFHYLVGSGSLLLPALLLGAEGAILAAAAAAPDLCLHVYGLYREHRLEEARKAQSDLALLHRTVVPRQGIAGLKYALDLLGCHGGPVRSPLLPLSENGRTEVGDVLKRLGLSPAPEE
ncbi:MAG: dihydrodipicolinate synthase family protein [Candidatus Aminicenantes bacterium]|nr:dihydrodipicolinate synthase family protein [Candidatus Aminicenantes bacterium]